MSDDKVSRGVAMLFARCELVFREKPQTVKDTVVCNASVLIAEAGEQGPEMHVNVAFWGEAMVDAIRKVKARETDGDGRLVSKGDMVQFSGALHEDKWDRNGKSNSVLSCSVDPSRHEDSGLFDVDGEGFYNLVRFRDAMIHHAEERNSGGVKYLRLVVGDPTVPVTVFASAFERDTDDFVTEIKKSAKGELMTGRGMLVNERFDDHGVTRLSGDVIIGYGGDGAPVHSYSVVG